MLFRSYFKEGITWTFISSGRFSVRERPSGSVFDVAGSMLFINEKEIFLYVLAFLSSNVSNYILKILNPTLNYQAGNIKNLPVCIQDLNNVDLLANKNIYISKEDWNSHETSWDFKYHPLV